MEDIYLLHGNIASEEVSFVRKLLATNFVYEVKKNEPDAGETDGNVHVVIKKYDILTFGPGFELVDELQSPFQKMKKVINYYSSIGKLVSYLAIDISIYYNFKTFSLLIITSPDEFIKGLNLINNELTLIAEDAKQDDCIKVKLINENLEIVNCNELKDMYTVIRDSSL